MWFPFSQVNSCNFNLQYIECIGVTGVTVWPYQNNNFGSVMSSRRFELLLKFLHLNDSRKQPAQGQPGYDKLYKVRPLLDTVVRNFQSCYSLTENLSIDESMVGFKGWLAFLQYMPKKPQKWGMKAWVLADSSNGYVWNWRLYTGKEVNAPESPLGLAHRVVLDLHNDDRLRNKGYRIFMDNFYSSPALFQDLKEERFEARGTLRTNRRGIPEELKSTKLRKGESHFSKDDSVVHEVEGQKGCHDAQHFP